MIERVVLHSLHCSFFCTITHLLCLTFLNSCIISKPSIFPNFYRTHLLLLLYLIPSIPILHHIHPLFFNHFLLSRTFVILLPTHTCSVFIHFHSPCILRVRPDFSPAIFIFFSFRHNHSGLLQLWEQLCCSFIVRSLFCFSLLSHFHLLSHSRRMFLSLTLL